MQNIPEPYRTLFEIVSIDYRPDDIPEVIRKGGAKLDYTDPNNGRTILYAAVRANRIRAVEILTKRGADPNQRFSYLSPVDGTLEKDRVVFHYVLSPEIIAALLAAGGNINAADAIGTTPLMCAAFHGHLAVVRTLLAAEADPNARQDKQHVRKAPSARELAEVKMKFFQNFVGDTNPGLTRSRLQCYGAIRELLLEAEGRK